MNPTLQYEPSPAARPVVVERDAERTRVILLDAGLRAALSDLSALVGKPKERPPRAVFEVTPWTVRMTTRDLSSAEVIEFEFPRAAVVEMRANRYEPGLWVHVTGYVKETYFADLPRTAIEHLEAALADALRERLAHSH